jgi:hypothetical protein
MTQRPSLNLPEDYLRWLEPQLRGEHDDQSGSYWDLIYLMFQQEFGWVLELDQNRIGDGMDLRVEFARAHRRLPRMMDPLGPCSFLEVLIGLSRRLAFDAGGEAPGWAWQLLGNLELHRMSDPLSRQKQRKVAEIMERVISRTYLPDGVGGFFPLAWPDDDQTRIEIWYQMSAYIAELHPGH